MMTFLSRIKILWKLAGGISPEQVDTLCEFIPTIDKIEQGKDWLGRPRTIVRFSPGVIGEAADFVVRYNDLPG